LQYFIVKDIRSNNIIHTTIRASRDNINPADIELINHNRHLQSVRSFEILMIILCTFFNLKQTLSSSSGSHYDTEVEGLIYSQKLVKLMKNKVNPENVLKIHQHRELVEQVTLIDKWTGSSNLIIEH
jgi:hypothetical protein